MYQQKYHCLCSSSNESDDFLNLHSSDEEMAEYLTYEDFMLVEYSGPRLEKYFIGCVEDVDQNFMKFLFVK